MQWLRRLSQAFFLVSFIGLVLLTHFRKPEAGLGPVRWFFQSDPLTVLATWLSTYALVKGAALALVTVFATMALGRVFCGWVCPFGALHAAASWFRARRKKKEPERRSPWQRGKYFALVALLIMALFGAHWTGVFDPIPLFYRAVATAILPAAQYAVSDSATYVYRTDPQLGAFHFSSVTEPVYAFSRDNIFRVDRQTFEQGTLIALLLIGIVALNLFRPRFWCRYICPLGGLLGLLVRRPLLRLRNDESKCTNCGLCNRACPAAAQPDQRGDWLPSECFGCWNCVAACRTGAITFEWDLPWRKPDAGTVDFSRRSVLAAGVTGAAALLSFRVAPQARAQQPLPDTLLRPPGARIEREFLQRCIQCGVCMRACPTNALQPCGLEAGLEALWTPKLVPKLGYCLNSCNLCGQLCPTEAIQPLTMEQKAQVKIGLAAFDTARCLPHNYGRDCMVCEEHCPLSPKAIYVIEKDVTLRDGVVRRIKQPFVDPDRCTGCGLCEWSCVFQDRAAIRVTPANETRNPRNQPILPGAGNSPYG